MQTSLQLVRRAPFRVKSWPFRRAHLISSASCGAMSASKVKVAIFGGGAVGGFLATQLGPASGSKLELSVVCREETVNRIRAQGCMSLEDRTAGKTHMLSSDYFYGSDETGKLGAQDYVISCLKGHQVAEALPHLQPLIGSNTCVVMLQNGIPFWHNASITDGRLRGKPVDAVDPGGTLLTAIPASKSAGCVCRIAVQKLEPGKLRLHTPIPRTVFAFGEAALGPSERLERLVGILNGAGVPSNVEERIHDRIWEKLCVSASANTVNVLTAGTVDNLIADADMYTVMKQIMDEVIATAGAIGVRVPVTSAALLEEARGRWRDSKFSMAQDADAGKQLEIAPYVTAVQEIARLAGTPTPTLDTVSALLRHFAANRGVL